MALQFVQDVVQDDFQASRGGRFVWNAMRAHTRPVTPAFVHNVPLESIQVSWARLIVLTAHQEDLWHPLVLQYAQPARSLVVPFAPATVLVLTASLAMDGARATSDTPERPAQMRSSVIQVTGPVAAL